jgi:hypothetical protein
LRENVTIAAEQGGLGGRNAKGVMFKNVKVTTKTGEAFVIKDAEGRDMPTAAK